ncbi:peptide/nickel transport system ATP-binding protein [Tindallia magadiensis]|uniref:Peptide/nickel transport system ATP-binding protein n=1 Tax=Tindallia magadiensis TaxID=69895 RepID=A0A1I3HN38_9FIRM|nr:ABC transporter ATP-binding protein [Tindallia magadiensis]SFI36920.1 peptide/nickel transport system ATP-binding protein [Tindallia magadiensis]
MSDSLMEVNSLTTEFKTEQGNLVAVNDISFHLKQKEVLGIVGESGSGKSVTSLSILKLLPENGCITKGSVCLEGRNLLELSNKELRKVRGGEIAMIFQDPMSSLNPVMTVGEQMMEMTMLHLNHRKSEARAYAIEMIKQVGIPAAEDVFQRYPHQLSGGMSQRIIIAMALSSHPKVIIADEPTTALDVTIQAQVLDLMLKLKEKNNVGILLITHDLGVVAETCDRVLVMYCGRIVESADVNTLFQNPLHPYTRGLMASVPKIGNTQELKYIQGRVPDLSQLPEGCKFAPRCRIAVKKCFESEPPLVDIGNQHLHRCYLAEAGVGKE